MKKQRLGCFILVATSSVLLMTVAHAEEVLCEDKRTHLRQQIEHAQAHDNQHRIWGLQRALQAIEANCTNGRVLAEAADDVRKSQEDVREREVELEDALRNHDENDIQKRRAKLEEATRELEEHSQELDALQHRLDG